MEIAEHLAEYEKALGLPQGFIQDLEKQGDDWSFTIKAHALIETGLTELLLNRIHEPLLEDMLAKLPISGQFSKLAISRALLLFGDDGEGTRQFIETLGMIRNRLVHNIKRGVDFSLDAYFQTLSAEHPDEFHRQRKSLDLVFGDLEMVKVNDEQVKSSELFKVNARRIIGSGLGLVLTRIHLFTGAAKAVKEMQEQALELFRSVVIAGLKKAAP
jgi:hypothetical protein